jgi:hypothetical protein
MPLGIHELALASLIAALSRDISMMQAMMPRLSL